MSTIQVPDEILLSHKMDPANFARDVLTLAPVKLFEFQKLSSGGQRDLRERSAASTSLP